MDKRKASICIIVFITVCAGVLLLFRPFTNFDSYVTDTSLSYDSAEFTDDEGNTEKLDMSSAATAGAPRTDGFYTLTARTGPIEQGEDLTVYIQNADTIIWVDGAVMYDGRSTSYDSNPMRVLVTLSPSVSGKEVRVQYRYDDLSSYIFPPVISVSSSSKTQEFDSAMANYYGVPAGISCLLFLLICGAFLIGLAMDKPDFSLPFVALATFCHMATSLYSTGAMLEAPFIGNSAVRQIMLLTTPAALIIYMVMNRRKKLFRLFLYFNLIAALFLLAVLLLSALGGIQINEANTLLNALSMMISAGSFNPFIILLTRYLVFSSAGAAIVFCLMFFSGISAEAQMLREKNKLIASGYDSIVSNYRHTSEIRHEWKNDLITMNMMYRQKKMKELGEYLEKRNEQLAQIGAVSFTENFIMDVILQSAAQKAQEENIRFRAVAVLPEQLPIDDADLCSLLMNMLDNAIEACQRIKDSGRELFIDFNAEYRNGFLAVSCRNSCDESQASEDMASERGTSKSDRLSHGFGLHQMNIVVKKYNSILDIIHKDGVFTVQTALNLKKNEKEKE